MSNFTATLPSWPAGHIILDTEASAVLAGLTAVTDAWTSLTPLTTPALVWSTTGTAPAIGNGTISGAYKQIGKTVYYRGSVIMGTTTTFGTGAFRVNFPVAPASFAGSNQTLVGSALVYDDSAATEWAASIFNDSSTTMRIAVQASAGGIDGTHPQAAWAAVDRFAWSVIYEAA